MFLTFSFTNKVIVIASLVLVVFFILSSLTGTDRLASSSDNEKGLVEQTTQREAQVIVPNYDSRVIAPTIASPVEEEVIVEVDFDENEALINGEIEIDKTITAYDNALANPEMRADIQKQLNEKSAEYKKAILVKLSKNEL